MYSLLVTIETAEKSDGLFTLDRKRFLEHTEEAISEQLSSLSREAVDALLSWPCLLMQEGKGAEEAFLVHVQRIVAKNAEMKIDLSAVSKGPSLLNGELWKMKSELDIDDFEFSRNHWAIKDRNLFKALSAGGYDLGKKVEAKFRNAPLPMPSRAALLAARDAIGKWSHTQIDDLLIEIGVAVLSAPRVGNRRDRANKVLEFALANPSAVTADKNLLTAFLVDAARRKSASAEADPDGGQHGLEGGAEIAAPLPPSRGKRIPNRVFVVHGGNETARNGVVAFLDSLGLVSVVLHEQPSMGDHLLTKFIREAELATFAVVLMTADDEGARKGGPPAPRARQNVILELGYFLSHLKQPNVCALISPGLETPSDFDGIVYIRMEPDERWKKELRRELEAAKLPIKA